MPSQSQNRPRIREATANDAALIVDFIRRLAEYEREPDAAVVTEADILRDGFSSNPKFWVLIAEWAGKPAGFAFYFYIYSTWQGRAGLFLEDLFVLPELRGKKIGLAFMRRLARIGAQHNCYAMRWQVLDWNAPAIRVYESLGAKFLDEWRTMRLDEDKMKRLAGEDDSE